jgi:uncharacterized phage-associated protein
LRPHTAGGENEVTDVFDVAQYILEVQGEMTAMKLQKLVYYSQAWHTVWADDNLFENRIEAWKDGPVCPDLWKEHANSFKVSRIDKGDSDKLNKREKKSIKQVLEFYGKRSAQWLSDLTHSEDPWLDARRDTKPGARSNAPITPRAMQEYYSSL